MVGRTLEALRDFALQLDPKAFEKRATNANGATGDFDWHRPAYLPMHPISIGWEYFVARLTQAGDRSAIASAVINYCMRNGWTPEQVYEAMTAHEGSAVMQHYGDDDFEKRLRADIRRLWTKPNPNDKTDEQVFGDAALWADKGTEATPERTSAFLDYMRQKRRAIPGYTPPEPLPLFMTAKELDERNFPPKQDIWQGLIPEQLLTLLYADGGTGKTLLAQWLAIHVAAGLPLFGRATRKQPVLLVLCEDEYERVQSSMRQICEHVRVKFADLRITFCCTPDDPTLAVLGDKGEIDHRPFLRQLVDKLVAAGEPCFVVLDTVSDIAELNENLRLPVNSLCKRVLQPICKELGATVLVNCHPSGEQMRQGRMGSGTTAWKNAIRNRLVLIADDKIEGWLRLSNKRIHGGKSNYGECEPLRLKHQGVIFSLAPTGEQLPEGNLHEGFLLLCAREAIRHAEDFGRPMVRPHPQRKKEWNAWPDQAGHLAWDCENQFGVVPGASHFWQHLHHAEKRGYLTYLTREITKGNKPAGYYAGKTPLPPRGPKVGAGTEPF